MLKVIDFWLGIHIYRCVLPNKMFVQLAENVNPRETCAMQPQGVVRICAIEARNLMKMDVSF
jgi:hypothetical protein